MKKTARLEEVPQPIVAYIDIETLGDTPFGDNFGADVSSLISFSYAYDDGPAKVISLRDRSIGFGPGITPYDKEKELIKKVRDAVSKADIVVHHYGDRFDYPYIATKCLIYNLKPPTNQITIDTWKIAKYKLKLRSNRLGNLCKVLKVRYQKKKTSPRLWMRVAMGEKAAMLEMEEYNKYDVLSLRSCAKKLATLFPDSVRLRLPSMALAKYGPTDRLICPGIYCKSREMRRHSKTRKTNGNLYYKYKCGSCGRMKTDLSRRIKEENKRRTK